MADNLRSRETEIPEDREAESGISAYAFMLKLASAVMRLFSSFVSRERELLADSTAVEMTRNPLALARAVYRAHTGYSFLGNGVQGYSPLFIVSPKSRGLDAQEGFLSNLFSTHPPVISPSAYSGKPWKNTVSS
jgi:heat shock protein HtpX